MKNFLLGLVVVVAAIGGCMAWQDCVIPAKVPTTLSTYLGKEPNSIGYHSKDKLETFMAEAKVKNLLTQAELEYLITKDKAVYDEIAKQAEFYRKQAEATSQAIFGQNGLLIGLLGLVGGGVAARMYSTATLYNKTEVAEEVKTAIETEKQILYTEAEVKAKVEETIESYKALRLTVG